MRRFSTAVAFVLVTLLFVSISSAQQAPSTAFPNLIRYSGTLKDVQGTVPPGTPLGVTFAIYKQQDGGAAVWQETQNVTPDANGQYSVILGSTTATGLPDDLFSQQEQRWLAVQVQGQDEQARVLLVSVPYAFKAHEAETLGGLPASAFVKMPPTNASGNTGTDAGSGVNAVGTAGSAGGTPNGKGTAGPIKAPCSGLTGGGTLPQIAIWDGPCDLVSSGIYQPGFPGGPVGILNPSPIAALDVTGAINTSISNFNSANYQILENPVLSIGWPSNLAVVAHQNLYVGVLAGAQGFVQTSIGTGNFGINNTFVGYNAAFHNQGKSDGTKGSSNTAVGVGAGYRNTNGNNNTFLGVEADFGMFNTAVSNNTITGYQAGFQNTGNNTSIYGRQAGYNNTADDNVFLGSQSGFNNTSGAQNTFIGTIAGYKNVAGSSNTIIGYEAGYTATGNSNTLIGIAAGYGTTPGIPNTGSSNTMMGRLAGQANTTGSRNAFFGDFAGGNNTSGMWNVFLGQGAGDSTTTGSFDTYVGTGAGAANQAGSNNIFLGLEAGDFNGTGSNNIYLGSFGANEDHTIRIGMNGTGDGQENRVFVEPILPNLDNTSDDVVTVALTGPNAGQLGHRPGGGGGGTVLGTCLTGNQALNYLTKWQDFTTVQCSSIYENTTAYPIGPQVGIGTGSQFVPNPSSKLEIAYTDFVNSTNPNPSVLRLINLGDGHNPTETGIMFNGQRLNAGLEDIARYMP